MKLWWLPVKVLVALKRAALYATLRLERSTEIADRVPLPFVYSAIAQLTLLARAQLRVFDYGGGSGG